MPITGIGSKGYSVKRGDYKLLEEIGHGASATVYRAIYLPFNEVVAVKCLDLDRCNSNLDDIRREAQTMSLIDHPNVIRAYCSFAVEHNLWVVMPFMAQGSCMHLMKIAYPDGFEERAICSILKETLKALDYLHKQGHIHRDVKAGNILLDNSGEVKLGDFGVTACMFDRGDRQRSRNTFVGTPCWMAPEVLQQGSGYDFKADIWSFGITALELAHGHAPFSKYPPMKVLLMTIQNAPPGLDYDRDKKFSKSFKELVAMCLVKDPTKRPTVQKLLKHSFFKSAKSPEQTVKKLFADLPPLWDRVKAIEQKDAASLALKKMPSAEQEAISQSEYQRGVSAWNFDIDDLKAQASLVQDDDGFSEIREGDESVKSINSNKDTSECGSYSDKSFPTNGNCHLIVWTLFFVHGWYLRGDAIGSELQTEIAAKKGKSVINGLQEPPCQENITKVYDANIELAPIISEMEATEIMQRAQTTNSRQTQSGPIMPGAVHVASSSEKSLLSERPDNESQQTAVKVTYDLRKTPSLSGPLMLSNRASANSLSAPIKSSGGFRDSIEDKSKANLVQKGRFSITSANVDLIKDFPSCSFPIQAAQGSPLRKSASVGDWISDAKQMLSGQLPKELSDGSLPASLILPHLQSLLQQTSAQQELILSLVANLPLAEIYDASQNGKIPPVQPHHSSENGNIEAESPEKESLLLQISELQARMDSLTDELNAELKKHQQLQQQLNALSGREGYNYKGEGTSDRERTQKPKLKAKIKTNSSKEENDEFLRHQQRPIHGM
ncbi:hypothetical protein V2J09_020119 [Rumex salicifolius]